MSARLTSTEAVAFLKTCEGAAAEFSRNGLEWSLWMPELPAQERPVTPATQLCFPVILRNDEQAFAMRFYYDCSTGKMRYYAGAIPTDVARASEFEAAVSAMFSNRLDVEPIKQRRLMKRVVQKTSAAAAKSRLPEPQAWAEPDAARAEKPKKTDPTSRPAQKSIIPEQPAEKSIKPEQPAEQLVESEEPPETKLSLTDPKPVATAPAAPVAVEASTLRPQPAETRVIRFELCERTRNIVLILAGVLLFIGLAGIGGWVYVQRNVDVGVLHHQMQLESMRLRSNTP